MKVFQLLACLLVATSLAAENTFPPRDSGTPVRGELVSADFIHRSGQFRTEKGELMDFTMPPYAVMKYRGVEADLREVPLGTKVTFLMLPDQNGQLTRLITIQDDQPTDEAQQQKFIDFTKARGVAGWIDKTDGRDVTVTFFSGNPTAFKTAYESLLVKEKEVRLCVANDELRTWNPGVDGERGAITEVKTVPLDRAGCSGFQIVARVPNMLEGFRRGRVVRVFLAGWKAQDQFYGESLMGYGFGRMLNQELVENVGKEYPGQFPFRTDYGNDTLPWFQLKPGQEPPPFSEHIVCGSLVNQGQFLAEGTGEVVDFTLIEKAKVRWLNKDAKIEDIPAGTRCRFSLYQDGKGAFTKASLVSDDFSHRAGNYVTLRVEAIRLAENRIEVSWLLPEVKNYNGDMERPQPIGHSVLRVTKDTRAWKLDRPVALADLTVGDLMLINTSAELPGRPAECTDLWIGEDTIKLVSAAKKPDAKK